MADNVAITAGSGTNIATDDAGAGGHVQVVKLAISTDGSATYIPASTSGLSVVVASTPKSATATLTNVGDSATSVTIDASNANRLGLILYNDSTASCYVKYGATASATSFTVFLGPGAYWEMPEPIYTGIVDGIWTSDAGGNMRVTELTA